jgi:hypothetical protein
MSQLPKLVVPVTMLVLMLVGLMAPLVAAIPALLDLFHRYGGEVAPTVTRRRGDVRVVVPELKKIVLECGTVKQQRDGEERCA